MSVISDIGLSLISESPISDWESGVQHYIGYRNEVLSDIRHPTFLSFWGSIMAEWYSARLQFQKGADSNQMSDIGIDSDVDIGTLPISK